VSVVVVTGATGDTGRAACVALLAAGHTVVAVGSDESRLATVTASTRLVCDLTDAAATLALAAAVRAEVGRPDALVHLVGGWRAGHGNDDWNWLEPRILTTLRLATLAFMDDLTASPAGRLVTIGSITAAKPTWSGANYTTLKTAAQAWQTAVASAWRKAGTGAAIELLVQSIGDGTPVEMIATRITELMGGNAAELNGSRVDLTL
jgi:3-oxoacyl-[acyl-carrier protein] reductase